MQHKNYSITQVAEVIGAQQIIADKDAIVRNISFDSRKIVDAPATLFFALKGRRNGADFIAEAYKNGVRNFVIASEDKQHASGVVNANILLVADTAKALQVLTAFHRRQFQYPVIGITGSNGKTIVKEWLYQLLVPENTIVRSPKSYNSQIGVPLSVWSMTAEHSLGIFEAGISTTGEMDSLKEIIQPTIGILTNIGEAHNEGFSGKAEKAEEKLRLFADAELLVYSPDTLPDLTQKMPGKNTFTWSFTGNADLKVVKCSTPDETHSLVEVSIGNQIFSATIPFQDKASLENAVCCWATLVALGYMPALAAKRLEKLQPVKMRLELKNGINNCSVIDDSYSSDFSSLSIALDFLLQQNQHQKRTLILSDIPQAGIESSVLYRQIASLLSEKKVDRLIGVGSDITRYQEYFNQEKTFFNSTADLIEHLPQLSFSHETILLKGARSFQFERISKLLTSKVHDTVLEINLNALEHNLNYYKSMLQPGVKMMVMVKAFSYGSGSFEIANLLQFNKVDYLAVAYADEGVTLRKAGITLPIMVMNPDYSSFELMMKHNLEPEIYSFRVLREFSHLVEQAGLSSYPVHLKLDTGMHRLGFMYADLPGLLNELQDNRFIKILSAFSHLVASEDAASDDFTQGQIASFRKMTGEIEHVLGYSFLRHISNTSGISRHPEAQFDMVRLGIGLYGFDSSVKGTSALETVTTLKTIISQIKELGPGETVGYNRRGVLPNGGKIATVKIGYADGYNRHLGNGKGTMLINGTAVKTIGSICMDMCMLDITGLDADEGDEVIVFNEKLRVEEIAQTLGTIPYEVLTSVSERVKRVYFYE